MSMNKQINTFLTSAAEQATGKTVEAELDYDGVIHDAGDWTWGEKEQFLGALSAQWADTIYTDSEWNDKYGDLFYKNSDEFGAIVQIINVELPEIRKNTAWDAITSGETAIGSNIVYLPVVKEQLTGGTSSWALPYALTGTQMNAAFKDAAGLRRFESYVKLASENSAKYHLSRMSAANRNNFIMSKLAAAESEEQTGKLHVVNLLKEYNTMFNASLTVAQFLTNTNGCLRQVNRIFKKYRALITDMTTLFTMDPQTTGKFVPRDRLAFIVLSDFVGLLESELYSTTFHDEFVKMDGYREVPFWQAIKTNGLGDATFGNLSSLWGSKTEESLYIGNKDDGVDSPVTAGFNVNSTGVVALMCDRWAIMNTVVRHRMGVQRDDIKDITLFEHQYTDRYINNLMLNGIVFIVDSYS